MKATVCQLPNDPEQLHTAWSDLVAHARSAASDVVLLPEMPFHPWLAVSREPSASAWESAVAAHCAWLPRLAELAPAQVVLTRPVIDAGERRNRATIVRPGGSHTDVHDKFHLPDEPGYWEATWYRRGDGTFATFELAGAMAGILVCTEMWFFDHAREYGQLGASLLLVPRATPRQTRSKWLAGGRAAAVVSGCYCLSSNLWQPPGGEAELDGHGWIVDPDGEVLATTSVAEPFASVVLDLESAATAKSTYPRYVAAR